MECKKKSSKKDDKKNSKREDKKSSKREEKPPGKNSLVAKRLEVNATWAKGVLFHIFLSCVTSCSNIFRLLDSNHI